jgi:N-acetylglucosaminyldiphosphoundecaprenol N-acetyl-beta-D-mannosaminyltransferase
MRSIELFGLRLTDGAPEACATFLMDQAAAAGPVRTVFFVNAHCVNVMARDAAYASALQAANWVLPDGVGLELSARLSGAGRIHNLNGTDLFPLLLARAAERRLSVGFVGARPGVAARCAQRMRAQVPGLDVVLVEDGYQAAPALQHAIAAGRPAVLFVAMGVPMQEKFVVGMPKVDGVRMAFGVGALFDFYSGAVPRAPLWMRRARLEWLYRLGVEPRRMFGRYVLGNVRFLARLALLRLRGRAVLRTQVGSF